MKCLLIVCYLMIDARLEHRVEHLAFLRERLGQRALNACLEQHCWLATNYSKRAKRKKSF